MVRQWYTGSEMEDSNRRRYIYRDGSESSRKHRCFSGWNLCDSQWTEQKAGARCIWGSKDNSANIQIYESNTTAAQKWKVTHDEKGYLTFINMGSGKALDVVNGLGNFEIM